MRKNDSAKCQNWIYKSREKSAIRCKLLAEKYIKNDSSRKIIDEPMRFMVSDDSYSVGMEEYEYDDYKEELDVSSIVSEKESKK